MSTTDVDVAVEEFRKNWPAMFAGPSLDAMTERGYRYRTLLNEISRGEAPRDILVQQGGRKNLILRDRFLNFWRGKLVQDGGAA